MENKKNKKPTYNVWEITSLQAGIIRQMSAIDTRKLCTDELNRELDRYSQSKTHLDDKMWVSIINQLLFDECSTELWKKLAHIVDTYRLTYI